MLFDVNHVYVFWDVETTSNDPIVDDIISIALIACRIQEGVFIPVSNFSSLITTSQTVSNGAFIIHGITNEKIKSAPTFHSVMGMMQTWMSETIASSGCKGTVFIAHNGSKFDDIIMFCNLTKQAMRFDTFMSNMHCVGFLDSLKMFKGLSKRHTTCTPRDKTKKVSFTLNNCFATFCGRGDIEGAHDALVDTQTIIDIFNSDIIRCKIDLHTLFEFVVKLHTKINSLKQSSGLLCQRKFDAMCEEDTTNAIMFPKNKRVKLTTVASAFNNHMKVDGFCLHCVASACLAF